LRERECALSELVEHVRIISVKSPNDALTIDVELISNIDYFMKIMKLVDEEFLIRDYRI
jgi:D-ribose pyranose/furanose isomerase RbsD